jgi:dihydroorotase-like cyclic amidohydrolase
MPARVAGLAPHKGALEPGADGDLVILDPDGPERPLTPTLADVWSPWHDRTTRLALRHVLLRGEEVVRDGELVDPAELRGRVVAPRL